MVNYHFSYFTTNTYVVGAQMNCLNETVLLNIQRMDKKILSLSCDEIFCSNYLDLWIQGRGYFVGYVCKEKKKDFRGQ